MSSVAFLIHVYYYLVSSPLGLDPSPWATNGHTRHACNLRARKSTWPRTLAFSLSLFRNIIFNYFCRRKATEDGTRSTWLAAYQQDFVSLLFIIYIKWKTHPYNSPRIRQGKRSDSSTTHGTRPHINLKWMHPRAQPLPNHPLLRIVLQWPRNSIWRTECPCSKYHLPDEPSVFRLYTLPPFIRFWCRNFSWIITSSTWRAWKTPLW